ncbi:MAG: 4Fe-4S binding protein [Candidatus Omnitrophica bacterium]|nr:4Fe-4S binding protein [Candidatus Omnitrophota bacterium]
MFGPLTCKPGSSRNNKTGPWRTESRPKFLKKNCIACNMCLLICPESCISGEGKNTYDFDPDYCKGCGNCARICPKQDIEMVKEDSKE